MNRQMDDTIIRDVTSFRCGHFGILATGGFRNCAIANCTFRNCHGLALEEVDGGSLENIRLASKGGGFSPLT